MMKLTNILFELLTENKEAQLRKNFVKTGKLTDQEFEKIIEADPTNIKKYSDWLMNKFYKEYKEPILKQNKEDSEADKKERISKLNPKYRQFFEDLETKVTWGLELFSRVGNKFPKKNIQDYKTIEEFVNTAIEIDKNLPTFEKEKGKEKSEKYPELIIGNVEGFTVYKFPQSRTDLWDIHKEIGSGTRWCTAADSDNGRANYNRYNRSDALYSFIKGNEKYQHDQYSNSWMNKDDNPMRDEELKNKFKEFLGKIEGRLYDANQLQNLPEYKIGDYDSPSGKLPLYKVGNKLYTIINNTAFYYDPDIKKFKDVKGGNMRIELLFKEPYMSFTKEVYNELKEQGNTKVFPGIYRLLLDLDVPEKAPGDYWVIPDGLDVSGTDLDSLPDNLHIQGDLDITDTKIKNLPQNLKVDGEIFK